MDFRKVEEGKMTVYATKHDIGEFIIEIANEFKNLARKKHISLNVNNKTSGLIIYFDESMIDKVLFNLLSNAFKFTEENGIINIIIDKDKEREKAIIIIEDNGIGMSTEDVEHAFDLFYQGHSSTFKGTGLGLSLSRELIHVHKGTIEIKSKKGHGTSFTITLPFEQDKNNQVGDHMIQNDISKDTYIYTTDILPHQYEKVSKVQLENIVSILIQVLC